MAIENVSGSNNHNSISNIFHAIIDPITKLFWAIIDALRNHSSKVEKQPVSLEQQKQEYLDRNLQFIVIHSIEPKLLEKVKKELLESDAWNTILPTFEDSATVPTTNMALNGLLRRTVQNCLAEAKIVSDYQSSRLGDSDTESRDSDTSSQVLDITSLKVLQTVPPLPREADQADIHITPQTVGRHDIRNRYYQCLNGDNLCLRLYRPYHFVDVSHILPPSKPPVPIYAYSGWFPGDTF